MAKEIEMVYLSDGREIPKACVDALDEYEDVWPGATLPQARYGIAWAVIAAYKKELGLERLSHKTLAERNRKLEADKRALKAASTASS